MVVDEDSVFGQMHRSPQNEFSLLILIRRLIKVILVPCDAPVAFRIWFPRGSEAVFTFPIASDVVWGTCDDEVGFSVVKDCLVLSLTKVDDCL